MFFFIFHSSISVIPSLQLLFQSYTTTLYSYVNDLKAFSLNTWSRVSAALNEYADKLGLGFDIIYEICCKHVIHARYG